MSTSIFSKTASTSNYERMTGNCTRIVAAEMVRIKSPSITSSSYVLDNACGPGIVTEQVKLLHPETKILATDLSPSMIEEVQKRTENDKWTNVKTDTLDVRDLSKLADNTFTHVLTNMGIYVPNDPNFALQAIKEMYRILRIGGAAVTSMWADRVWLSAFSKTAMMIRPHEEPSNMLRMDPEVLRGSWLLKQIEDGGFGNNAEVRPFATSVSATSLEELVENMMVAAPLLLKGYDEEELSRVKPILKEELTKLRTYEALEGGAVRIGMKSWIGVGWKKGDEKEVPL
ncbi:Glandicoline B O-methyltransferase roqN [Lachnellula arida]|uniref:Glandicoline B O-methyltransferase roqN n=1 Tax=Lachnellula arida TaxID=1316785 RepID=A0A8T9B4Z1_9HELO|nr:Glandicoline B O-methyltransferase roqN [Lachnellula arida]